MTQRALAPVIVTDVNELVPLGAWLARYETEFGWGLTSTARAKHNDLNIFREFLMPRVDIRTEPVFSVTHALLNEFILERLETDAASTVRRRMATICHWARWVAFYVPTYRPPKVKAPQPVVKPPKWISEEDELKLLAASKEVGADDFERARNQFCIEAMLLTGMRANELLNLFEHQINHEQTCFMSVQRKGLKFTDLPIPARLKETLQAYMKIRKDHLKRGVLYGRWSSKPTLPVVISTHAARWDRPNSFKMSYTSLWRLVADVAEHAGLSKLAPHQCRHTFGRRLYEATLDVMLVAKAMSHSSTATTLGYCSPSQDTIAEAVNRIAERYK